MKPLYVSLLDLSFNGRGRAQAGAALFRQFHLCELTEQMRAAECLVQQSLVDSFRCRTNPIRHEDLHHLKQLTATDVSKDPSWLDALYVTSGNLLRNTNRDCMQRIAHA